MQGCGITQENQRTGYPIRKERRNPRYDVLLQHKPNPTSRFADIKQASFFEKRAATPSESVPLAPTPVPLNDEPVVTTLAPAPVDVAVAPPAPAPAVEPATNLSSCRPVKSTVQTTQYEVGGRNSAPGSNTRAPVEDPRKLKKITEIQPYAHYEPDPIVRSEDPCRHLCPRPDGTPCEPADEAMHVCPEEVVLSNEQYTPRSFNENVFAWEASNVHYNPLYFEDFALERYGHTYPCFVQPFASVGRFGVQFLGLPYQMAIDPVCKDIYPLGFYRPGECTPKLLYQVPWNTKAALTQAAVTTGMFYLIP